MIKLIASDMDGTLLKDNKEMDMELYEILPKLKEKGIRFMAASGRQFPSLQTLFQDHLEDVILIAENGAYVVHNGEELYASNMPKDLIHFAIDEIEKLDNVGVMLCGKDCCYTRVPSVYETLRSPKFHYSIALVEDLHKKAEEVDIIKVSLVDGTEGGASDYSFPILEKVFAGIAEIAVSGFDCIDIVNKGVSKGAAIAALQQKWGITPEETLVFGDNYNDIEMLQQAKYSYAMEKAEDGVKKHANYIAGDNNEGAVVTEIKRLTNI